MPETTASASAAENPCCAAWKEKYTKLLEKRNALRQAVDLLKTHSLNLQTSHDDEKAKEAAARSLLENEVSALKSEISSLRQVSNNGGGDNSKAEISRLEDLLRKEKARADSAEVEKRKAVEALKREANEARSKAESEKEVRVSLSNEVTALKSELLSLRQNGENGVKHSKKKISELEKVVRKERVRADSAEEEKKKAVEVLKREADNLRSKLSLETQKLEEANRKLEAQLQKVVGEKKRVDADRVKAEEQKKVAEVNRKKAEEEKCRADQLLRELAESKRDIEELRKERSELLSARKLIKSSVGFPSKEMNFKIEEMKLLKKQLKFEKRRVKHAEEVVKLERNRNGVVQQELARLKSEFDLFSQRLYNLDNCFSPSTKGIDEQLEKARNAMKLRKSESKLFHSSAKNSRGLELVSSQEVGALSGTTSVKMLVGSLSAQPTISSYSGQGAKKRCNANLAVVDENSVRSPLRVDGVSGTVNGHSKKRKRIMDVVESVENLYMQIEEKLSVLHGVLNEKVDNVEEGRCVIPDPQCGAVDKHDKLNKKRKKIHYHKEKLVMQNSGNGDERRTTGNCGNDDATACEQQASGPVTNLIGIHQACQDGIHESVTRNQEAMVTFQELFDGDYMNLLNLNSSVEEECYREARERPLSPALPEIEFTVSGTSHDPLVHTKGDLSNLLDELQNKGICGEVEISDIPASGKQEAELPGKSEIRLPHDSISGHFLVFPASMDYNSISRIFSAIRNCVTRCSLFSQTDWAVQKILLALVMEDKVLPEEKMSVFFPLLLLNFSVVAEHKFRNSLCGKLCVDSFAEHMCSVMADVETRNLFFKHCGLDNLLSFIEDFLVIGRVMVHKDESSETLSSGCDPRVNLLLDGVNIRLSSETASKDQLMAGSIILAAICTAIDHIGFLGEASYKISRMLRHDLSLMLHILHVFAYLGGEKYFFLGNDNLITTTMKSVVALLERQSVDASCFPCLGKVHAEFHPCAKCPFVEGAVSADTVTSLLLEKLRNNALSGNMDQNLKSSQSDSTVSEAFCQVIDVLSLVELVASNMSWDWTCINIVPQLLKLLELSLPDNLVAAVIIVLGQLGRVGVSSGGYEDQGVHNLRCKLCALLCQDTTLKGGLSTQVSTITALLGLLSLDFQDIVRSSVKLQATASQFVPADLIRKWFSLLNKEQQGLTLSLLQSTGSSSCIAAASIL